MMWFNIIKMPPNPYLSESGKKQQWKFLTREQYYKMNDKDKSNYHGAMATIYQKQLQLLRGPNQPLAAANETSQNELIDLQKLRNFHGNQSNRARTNKEMAFSIEDDKNPPTKRLQTTPMGNIQGAEWDLTEEEYNAATREEKFKYHGRAAAYKNKQDLLTSNLHQAENYRMRNHPNYTAPYNPEDAKSKEGWQKTLLPTPSKEEYENMSNDDKMKFHTRMRARYRKTGEMDLSKFHDKMRARIYRSVGKLPTYYSPEEERNA